MIRSFVSEWIRFRKTAVLGIAVMIFFSALITMFLLVGVGPGGPGDGAPDDGGPFGGAELSVDAGAVEGLTTALNMIGIVSLTLFALSTARDFEYGTIRNLLVGQPKRRLLLSGKLLGIGAYVVAGVTIAAVGSVLVAYALAPGQDIATESWTPLGAVSTTGQVAAAALLYGVIGAAIAMVTRSAALSITIGVGYLVLFENLIGLLWKTSSEWLPAGVLEAFAFGGTSAVSFGKATLLAAAYGASALVVMFAVFARRDITD